MLPWNWFIFTGDYPFWNLKFSMFHGRITLFKFLKEFQLTYMLPWNWFISRATYPFKIKKLAYFHRWPTIFQIPKRILASLYASLKLVYFHGRPTHFKFQKQFQQASILPWNWSIFMGDLMRTLWSRGYATHNQDWDLVLESQKKSDRSVA